MNTSRTKKQTKPVKLSRLRRGWFLKQESILNEITHFNDSDTIQQSLGSDQLECQDLMMPC
jgi:predicted ATPase